MLVIGGGVTHSDIYHTLWENNLRAIYISSGVLFSIFYSTPKRGRWCWTGTRAWITRSPPCPSVCPARARWRRCLQPPGHSLCSCCGGRDSAWVEHQDPKSTPKTRSHHDRCHIRRTEILWRCHKDLFIPETPSRRHSQIRLWRVSPKFQSNFCLVFQRGKRTMFFSPQKRVYLWGSLPLRITLRGEPTSHKILLLTPLMWRPLVVSWVTPLAGETDHPHFRLPTKHCPIADPNKL